MSLSIEKRVVEVARDLVALPSVNPEGASNTDPSIHGEGRVAEYVEGFFDRVDVAVTRQPTVDGRDNVVIQVPEGSDSPLCLEAHMDTVGVEGMAKPFEPEVREGKLLGRGSCDTKGSLAAMMVAVAHAVEAGEVPPCGLCLVAAVDEEYGHTGAETLIRTLGGGFCGVVVGEPTSLATMVAHKGQAYVKVSVRGEAAHTSIPGQGHNAIVTMAEVVDVLTAQGAVALAELGKHPLCGSSTLTVSTIHGGISEHVVPPRCDIALDLRLSPGVGAKDAVLELRRLIQDSATVQGADRVTVHLPYHIAGGLSTEPDNPFVSAFQAARGTVLGPSSPGGAAYNTDASILAAGGAPALVFGPGDVSLAHTTGELVDVDQLTAATLVLSRFIRDL